MQRFSIATLERQNRHGVDRISKTDKTQELCWLVGIGIDDVRRVASLAADYGEAAPDGVTDSCRAHPGCAATVP